MLQDIGLGATGSFESIRQGDHAVEDPAIVHDLRQLWYSAIVPQFIVQNVDGLDSCSL
jgi:hypothetical protein